MLSSLSRIPDEGESMMSEYSKYVNRVIEEALAIYHERKFNEAIALFLSSIKCTAGVLGAAFDLRGSVSSSGAFERAMREIADKATRVKPSEQ